MKWLDMLRDVGSRMSVNRMMSMESVKQRMTGEGAFPEARRVPGPSPNPATNLMIADIAVRGDLNMDTDTVMGYPSVIWTGSYGGLGVGPGGLDFKLN